MHGTSEEKAIPNSHSAFGLGLLNLANEAAAKGDRDRAISFILMAYGVLHPEGRNPSGGLPIPHKGLG